MNNPNFKVVEFDHFKTQAGLPSFVLSVSEWIEKTNAIGIIVKKVWLNLCTNTTHFVGHFSVCTTDSKSGIIIA